MSHPFSSLLDRLLVREDLESDAMNAAMHSILGGEWSAAQVAGFLVALRAKGETPAEIGTAARVMRSKVLPVTGPDPETLVDVVGTGGDGMRTFNISTTAAFIAAAVGVRVAKHCNRALSSSSGSSDLLAACGIDISVKTPEEIAQSIESIGIGFMFAPNHHGALKHAAPIRKDLGVRTIFNVLGPLTNPAGAKRQMTGVFDKGLVDVYVETLRELGSSRVLIVHGDGLDEITVAGETMAAELKQDGSIERFVLSPEQFGFGRHSIESIQVQTPEESKAMVVSVFEGKDGPCREATLMTAGASIYVAGLAETINEGVVLATKALDDGAALHKFEQFAAEFSATGAP